MEVPVVNRPRRLQPTINLTNAALADDLHDLVIHAKAFSTELGAPMRSVCGAMVEDLNLQINRVRTTNGETSPAADVP